MYLNILKYFRMSEVATEKRIPKPQMRGLLHTQIKKNLIAAGISVFIAGCYMKFVFGNGRKKAYIEFYK